MSVEQFLALLGWRAACLNQTARGWAHMIAATQRKDAR